MQDDKDHKQDIFWYFFSKNLSKKDSGCILATSRILYTMSMINIKTYHLAHGFINLIQSWIIVILFYLDFQITALKDFSLCNVLDIC